MYCASIEKFASIRVSPLKYADSNEIEYTRCSVGAAIMSREVVSRLFLYSATFFFFLSTFSKTSAYDLSDDCSKFDMAELEDFLSKLDSKNVPTIDTMIGGFKCPPTALPFGALKSDWARLLLLQKAQPDDSIFKKKLPRLFRLLLVAYFRMEERFDVVEQDLRTTKRFSRFNASSELASTTVLGRFNETVLTSVSPTFEVSTPRDLTLTSEFRTSNESTLKDVNDSISTFSTTNTTDITIFTGRKKSISGNVEDQQTDLTKSIFPSEVTLTTATDAKRNFKRTKGRGDFSMFHDFPNYVHSDEDTVSKEVDLKFITIQYPDTTDRYFVEFQKIDNESRKISDTEEATEKNDDYKSRKNGIFRVFKDTTLPWNKVKRPVISSKPPPNNDFWKRIVISRNITLIPPETLNSAPEDANDVDRNLTKSKKRGSLNTNIEKNFRWFYNLAQEDREISNATAGSQGAKIECSGRADEK